MPRSLLLSTLLAGAVSLTGLAACATFPAGPAAVAPAAGARLTIRPELLGYRTAATDVGAFTPSVVSKLTLALYNVDADADLEPLEEASETPVVYTQAADDHQAGDPVTLTRTQNFREPVIFEHLPYGKRYRIRATAYRTVNGAFEPISTDDASSYVDVKVALDTRSLNQTVGLKVRLMDRRVSAGFVSEGTILREPQNAVEGAPTIAYNPRTKEYLTLWVENATHDAWQCRLSGTNIVADTLSLISGLLGGLLDTDKVLQPSLAYHPTIKRYALTYAHSNSNGSVAPIKVVPYNGQDLPGQTKLVSESNAVAARPAIACDTNADTPGYLVAWEGSYNGRSQIRGRLLDSTGTPSGAILTLSPETAGQQKAAHLTYSAVPAQYLLTYASSDPKGVVVRVLGRNGVQAATYTLASGVSVSEPASALNSRTGTYLVTWLDLDAGRIVAQRLDNYGAPIGGAAVTLSSAIGHDPAVVYNHLSDEFVVAWYETVAGTDVLKAIRVDATGAAIGQPFLVGPNLHDADGPNRVAMAYNIDKNEVVFAGIDGPGGGLPYTRTLDFFALPLVTQ